MARPVVKKSEISRVSSKYSNIEAKGPLLDKVYSLRYQSYRTKEFINEDSSGLFIDKYDQLGNSRSFLTYQGDKLIGSIRCSHYTPEERKPTPVMEIFHDEIAQYVGLNRSFIEVNRFVVHPDVQNINSIRVRFNIFKNVVDEVDRTGVDCVIIGVRPEHVRFYQSIFSNVVTGNQKTYPMTNFQSILLACFDIDNAKRLILRLSQK